MPQKSRYRVGAHSRYTIFYHLVFCPRYRRKIFKDIEIDKELKETIREMAKFHDWIIEEMETDQDHIHLCLSAPPRYSPANIVNLIKTWTYKHIYKQHEELKEYLWGGKMWADGYYVSTVSDNATTAEIKTYIRQQRKIIKQMKLI